MKQISIKVDVVAINATIEVNLPEYLVIMFKITDVLAGVEKDFDGSVLEEGIDFLMTECNKIVAEVLSKDVMDIECVFASLQGDEGDSGMRIRVVNPHSVMEQMGL